MDGVTKTTEGSRPGNFNAIRQAVARGSGKGSFGYADNLRLCWFLRTDGHVSLRYTSAQGDVAVDSDAALNAALKDAEHRRQPYLRVVVTGQGAWCIALSEFRCSDFCVWPNTAVAPIC